MNGGEGRGQVQGSQLFLFSRFHFLFFLSFILYRDRASFFCCFSIRFDDRRSTLSHSLPLHRSLRELPNRTGGLNGMDLFLPSLWAGSSSPLSPGSTINPPSLDGWTVAFYPLACGIVDPPTPAWTTIQLDPGLYSGWAPGSPSLILQLLAPSPLPPWIGFGSTELHWADPWI